ncbi:hypothetical protein [Oryzihumus leptocrescens]|nr:hypothetical protein [Oryzihumus leptocrescens]
MSACAHSATAAKSMTPKSSTTASPTSAATTSASATAPVTHPRTAKELTAALLVLKDMPSGFSVQPKDNGAQPMASSTAPSCATFVKLSNAAHLPGSIASADRSFSGGQNGPEIDEELDALKSVDAATGTQQNVVTALGSCHSVKLAIPGAGTSDVKVESVSAPQFGSDPAAARMTMTSGPASGLEVTMVTTRVEDVELAMTFVGAVPDDIDGATQLAVEKVQTTLGASSKA